MGMDSILVFPANMPQSVSFVRIAKGLGFRIVEASSESGASDRAAYMLLPYITENCFEAKFEELLKRENIGFVYSPHPGVWARLTELSEKKSIDVEFIVCNEWPHTEDLHPYDMAYNWADECQRTISFCDGIMPPLKRNLYAGLHHGFSAIPGQSDDLKIWLLSQIFRDAKQGDVVEIGTAYGRSGYALAWLAKHHSIGCVICVDPWTNAPSEDQGEQAELLNKVIRLFDMQKVFHAFVSSVSCFDNVNYIRLPSVEASVCYAEAAAQGYLRSEEFGRTNLCGRISVLHVDGNHKYEEVLNDLASWLPFVMDGGWILLDDYVWAFGDGPKKVGDELAKMPGVETSFVVGDTLCLKVLNISELIGSLSAFRGDNDE